MTLALLIELGIACGAISLVVAKGKIFAKPHDWLEKKSPFLEELSSCSWCVSHWVSALLVLAYRKSLCNSFIDYIVQVFVVVAISQVVAAIMRKCVESQ
jgi:hypothetical protein